MRRALVLLVLLVLGLYVAGAALFLLREDDALGERADAVVVLAGDESRLPVALSLVRDGVAPVLVVSEDESGEDVARGALCADGKLEGVELVCRLADPFSTRGEARLVGELAEKRGWGRIVVVSSRYHLFRAERLIGRCTDAELVMRGSSEPTATNLQAIPFEWLKLGLAETARRGC
jgi:uncharacterized SAM-binding protein YcdF (DUF218 family)